MQTPNLHTQYQFLVVRGMTSFLEAKLSKHIYGQKFRLLALLPKLLSGLSLSNDLVVNLFFQRSGPDNQTQLS